ncbi:MAG: aminopeptidase [Niastella sp.]|nr:aminopeptidase [Niastella sp.]
MTNRVFIGLSLVFLSNCILAQDVATPEKNTGFIVEQINTASPVKNQGSTGTCWAFSTTSLVESQLLKADASPADVSEMFTVRNIYLEKARNYLLRQAKTQFGEGGLGHDVIRAINNYGAMPEAAYPFTQKAGGDAFVARLKNYLDSLLKKQPIAEDWQKGYEAILDETMGKPAENFEYKGKNFTAQSYAKEVLHFNADDYVNLTSFTHHPYYKAFVLEQPDNFSNGEYYNLPLNEFEDAVKQAIDKGYTIMWDADVSNKGFRQQTGLAMNVSATIGSTFEPDMKEDPADASIRQQLFENLTTQDDHLMHLTGMVKSKSGKTFFVVKNSWGNIGPLNGYINVSEAYFKINTISLVVPKASLNSALLAKLNM